MRWEKCEEILTQSTLTHSGEARTAEGGHPKRNQYAVMRYLFENSKIALEGLLMR